MFVSSGSEPNDSVDGVTARASDVAARFRELLPGAGDVKVHKLLYYVQGHHLAWHGRPAFTEAIEAWVNGPVVAELWRKEKHDQPPEAEPLDAGILEVIYMVASRYGHLSGKDLIKLTHSEDPWRDISESEDAVTNASTVISHGALSAFFAEDHPLTPLVRDRVAAIRAERQGPNDEWVPNKASELDYLEAGYSTP